MDLGATICTPKRPACALCPLDELCDARAARRCRRPSRARRQSASGALRRGAAFVALRADGTVLLRSRPDKGLLGGMTEVPTTEWSADFNRAFGDLSLRRLRKRTGKDLPGVVTHVFTHFPLELTVYAAEAARGTAAPEGARWIAVGGSIRRGVAKRDAQSARACT